MVLWLRGRRIGALACDSRALDKFNKPARFLEPLFSAGLYGSAYWTLAAFALPVMRTRTQDSKEARPPKSPQHTNKAKNPSVGEMEEDAASDKVTQEGSAAIQRVARHDDRAQGTDMDQTFQKPYDLVSLDSERCPLFAPRDSMMTITQKYSSADGSRTR